MRPSSGNGENGEGSSGGLNLADEYKGPEVAMFIHSEPSVRQLETWSNNIMRECGTGVKKASAPAEYLEDVGRLFASLL